MLDFQLDLLEVLLDLFQDRVGGNGAGAANLRLGGLFQAVQLGDAVRQGNFDFGLLALLGGQSLQVEVQVGDFLLQLLAAGGIQLLQVLFQPFEIGRFRSGLRGQRGRLRIGFQLAQQLLFLGGQPSAGSGSRHPG